MSNLQIVQHTNATAANQSSISLTLDNVMDNDGILIEVAVGGTPGAAVSSITDSGGTIQTAVAFSSFDYPGLGRYYIPASSSPTHTVTVNFNASVISAVIFMAEVNGSLALDIASATATGTNSTSPASAAITPAANGEFLSGFIVANGGGIAFDSWGDGFTQEDIYTGGPSTAWAYLNQGTAAPANASATLGTASAYWMASTVAYSYTQNAAQGGGRYRNVMLADPLNTGTGSICDPNVPWSNGAPGAGATVFFTPNVAIASDGTITTAWPNFVNGSPAVALWCTNWRAAVPTWSERLIEVVNGVPT
jgi:hypothetical protein